ncbi:MAG: hypothetical protein WD873_07870 [Candidatus Hydrogenedentales bacterium]
MNNKLYDIACARSGDKGNGANVGIIAYTAAGYKFLAEFLTAERVEQYFKRLGVGVVRRYELPNLHAFNFILPNILAGGGSRSLRIDAQGKVLGQALLEMKIDIPEDVYAVAQRPDPI